MVIELTPQQRAEADLAMPSIFDNDFHPDRFDWYTLLTIESNVIRGGAGVIPEFIAAMALESGLKNAGQGSIGNNAANGTPYSNAGFPSLGIGWCQLDTGYHVDSLKTMHDFRRDPLSSLQYIAVTSDLVYQGGMQTHFNKQRWHAWEPEQIDPPAGEWNALQAARDAWDRVGA